MVAPVVVSGDSTTAKRIKCRLCINFKAPGTTLSAKTLNHILGSKFEDVLKLSSLDILVTCSIHGSDHPHLPT